jgi:hypothetical protein
VYVVWHVLQNATCGFIVWSGTLLFVATGCMWQSTQPPAIVECGDVP